ncbi:MAG TPA: hypothetical protein VJ903_03325 [Clostridia bacterium]|nr:hypothetical protein [Clostridia bacterium]
MSALLISITAITLIGILVETLLTEGQTKKYIQGVLALAIVLVFLSNIANLVKSSDNLNNFIGVTFEEPITANIDNLNEIELVRYNLAQDNIENLLSKSGISNIDVTFSYGYNEKNEVFIQNIYVDTLSAVINAKQENININDKIIDACLSVVDIKIEGIIIDGKVATK